MPETPKKPRKRLSKKDRKPLAKWRRKTLQPLCQSKPGEPITGREKPLPRRPRKVGRPRRKQSPKGLRLERRGRYWHLVGTYRGVRIRKSLRTADFQSAQVQQAAIINAIDQASEQAASAQEREKGCLIAPLDLSTPNVDNKGPVTLAQCFSIYLLRSHSEANRKSVERLSAAIDEGALYRDVDEEFVENLARKLCRPGASDATIKRQVVSPLQAVMRRAHKRFGTTRILPVPQFGDFAPAKVRTITLYPDQADRMVALALARGWHMTARVIEIACCEGPRRGELCNLVWEAVDLERRRLVLRDTKARREEQRDRTICDLRPRSLASLRKLAALTGRSSGPVFLRQLKDHQQTSVSSFGTFVNKQLRVLSQEAGLLDQITLHVLRHTAASWHYLVQPDLLAVQKRMDWRTISITQRYVHQLTGTEPREVIEFWEKEAQP